MGELLRLVLFLKSLVLPTPLFQQPCLGAARESLDFVEHDAFDEGVVRLLNMVYVSQD